MKKIHLAISSLIFLSSGIFADTQTFPDTHTIDTACNNGKAIEPSAVISCYRQSLAAEPLKYRFLSNEIYRDVEVNRYEMISQSWSPQGMVKPAQWKETVTIAIPQNPKTGRALVAVDIDDGILLQIARETHTIVISLKTIPGVDLIYQNDNIKRIEDDSIARSWQLYTQDPTQRQQLPLQVPMVATISQSMRLAKKELVKWNINQFIVTGASKRGWATWLTGIADPDVVAIVPFVIDVLNIDEALKNLYRSYGGNWPIAFASYYNNGIDQLVGSNNFSTLLKIVDPLRYIGTPFQSRLDIPKYIVNSSGDDFFVPDNSRYYYDKLPGVKSLRVVPNTSHFSIASYFEQSLVPFINRLQDNKSLPTLTTAPYRQNNSNSLDVSFSEKPASVIRWTATNPVARDFRAACGIKYIASDVRLQPDNKVDISLNYSGPGWQASFIEATFADGYVATSQVYITPDGKYPTSMPPVNGDACKTIVGRGL